MATQPTPEQVQRYLGVDRAGPVVMVNVLRFKDRSEDGQGSGGDAYGRYGAVAQQTISAVGGRILWSGEVEALMIGDDEADRYDMVAVVEYPSRQAILEMTQRDDYQEGHKHRESGLECQLLLSCRTLGGELTS